jgi:hypothetical protein
MPFKRLCKKRKRAVENLISTALFDDSIIFRNVAQYARAK